jgi:hypothetical protein
MSEFVRGDYVQVERMPGVVCWVVGMEMEEFLPDPEHDCEAEGEEPGDCTYCAFWGSEPEHWERRPTGYLIVRMVGDDKDLQADPDDCTKVEPEEFCVACGQHGCRW